jgi:hypothetical protein
LASSHGNGRGQSAGETEGEESEGRSMEVDHALVIEMLPEKQRARITAYGCHEQASSCIDVLIPCVWRSEVLWSMNPIQRKRRFA